MKIPELGYREEKTSEYARRVFEELETEYTYPHALTGVKAKLCGKEHKFYVCIREISDELIRINLSDDAIMSRKGRIEKIKSRLSTIDKMISKLYLDNAEGKISDKRLKITVDELEVEYTNLSKKLLELEKEEANKETLEGDVLKFFNIVKEYTDIKELTRDILLTFVDRIEIGEKVFPPGVIKNTHLNQPFTQEIKIYYKFIKDVLAKPKKQFPIDFNKETSSREEVSIREIV